MRRASYLFTDVAFVQRGRSASRAKTRTSPGQDAEARPDLKRALRAKNEDVVSALLDLGFTAETVALIELMPVVQAAWAHGQIGKRDRETVLAMARELGLTAAAVALLESHLSFRADEAFFRRVASALGLLLEACAAGDAARARRRITGRVERLMQRKRGALGLVTGWLSRPSKGLPGEVEATLALLA